MCSTLLNVFVFLVIVYSEELAWLLMLLIIIII